MKTTCREWMLITISTILLVVCAPSIGHANSLDATAKQLLQKDLDSRFGLKHEYLFVENVIAVRESSLSNKYDGTATIDVFGEKEDLPLTVFSDGRDVVIRVSAEEYRQLSRQVESGQETSLGVGIIKSEAAKENAENSSRQNQEGQQEYQNFMSMPACAAGIRCRQHSNAQSGAQAHPQTEASTFAGSGAPGNANGTGTAASFNFPFGVTLDAGGNAYVADAKNGEIRKISPAGVVSTLAGSGTPGSANGIGAAASFNHPDGVAVDAYGNVYVADAHNNEIRKISPAGVVSTLAGSGTPGTANGIGTAASFNMPAGVAVDTQGNVYVADDQNCEIRKISPAGVVTTLAGSGTAGAADGIGMAASFNHPAGVALDIHGDLYVADTGNNEIRKINPAGVVSTLAGSGATGSADGIGSAASFNRPYGVAADPYGNVYVADTGNEEVRVIVNTTGRVVTIARANSTDDPVMGVAAVSSFNRYTVYATEGGDNTIDKITATATR